MLEQFGPALKLPWTKLEAPELTQELIDRMVEGTEAQAAGRSVRELERLRDDCLIAIMQALRPAGEGAGQIVARDEAQRLGSARLCPLDAGNRGARAARRLSRHGAAGVGGLQRPHVRMGLPHRLRLGERRAVPLHRETGRPARRETSAATTRFGSTLAPVHSRSTGSGAPPFSSTRRTAGIRHGPRRGSTRSAPPPAVLGPAVRTTGARTGSRTG